MKSAAQPGGPHGPPHGINARALPPARPRSTRPWPALLAQELRLAARHPGDTLAAVLFFVLVAALVQVVAALLIALGGFVTAGLHLLG